VFKRLGQEDVFHTVHAADESAQRCIGEVVGTQAASPLQQSGSCRRLAMTERAGKGVMGDGDRGHGLLKICTF